MQGHWQLGIGMASSFSPLHIITGSLRVKMKCNQYIADYAHDIFYPSIVDCADDESKHSLLQVNLQRPDQSQDRDTPSLTLLVSGNISVCGVVNTNHLQDSPEW